MHNYFKYLPVSKEDENWGLTVLNVGRTHIAAANKYPVATHPDHYHFDWKNGRVLQEYQIIYITNGQGEFESASQGTLKVNAGSIILLMPNERHRYKPDPSVGWDEYWIGIKGPMVENIIEQGFFSAAYACMPIGFHSDILDIFNEIIEVTKLERPGYQPLIAGAAVHLLGAIYALAKQNNGSVSEHEQIINNAQLLFRANSDNVYSAEMAAKELNVGYSWFRKHFKNHTGLSPGQYYLQLKIERAKQLLTTQNCTIKEIAYQLSFENAFYFSKVFKEKTGIKPTEYRRAYANTIGKL